MWKTTKDLDQVIFESKIRKVKESGIYLDNHFLCAKVTIYMKIIGLDTYKIHHALSVKVHNHSV